MMAAYLRLNKSEDRKVSDLCKELNKQRIELDMKIIQQSKVLHELIEIALKNVEVEKGEIKLKTNQTRD